MDINKIKKIMIIILVILIIAILFQMAKKDKEIKNSSENMKNQIEKEKEKENIEDNTLEIENGVVDLEEVYISGFSDILDYMSDYKEVSKLNDLIKEKIEGKIELGEETVLSYRMESIRYDKENSTLSFIINSIENTESTYSVIVSSHKTEFRKLR